MLVNIVYQHTCVFTLCYCLADPNCLAGWDPITGTECYKAMNLRLSFWDAVTTCEAVDGDSVGLSNSGCAECMAAR